MIKEVSEIVSGFKRMGLNDVRQDFLQNRSDRKFFFEAEKLEQILPALIPEYDILEVNHRTFHAYRTCYFDTAGRDLYQWHHNGKGNRFKLRYRQYENGELFFEIKQKKNKNKTEKHRKFMTSFDDLRSKDLADFLRTITGAEMSIYSESLMVGQKRVSLIKKDFSEKLTIDTDLKFEGLHKRFGFHSLAIAEVKHMVKTNSLFLQKMKECRIAETSFSKYCMGMMFAEEHLKSNAFKPLKLKLNAHKYDF